MQADLDAFEIGIAVPEAKQREALKEATPRQLTEVLRLRLPPPEDRSAAIRTDGYELVAGTHRVEAGQLIFTPDAPLLAGRTYVIQSNPQNIPVEPKPEEEAMERWFTVPHRVPNVDAWVIRPPSAGTVEPLIVIFDEQTEGSTAVTVSIQQPERVEIAGQGTWNKAERRWEFIPEEPWSAGKYDLRREVADHESGPTSVDGQDDQQRSVRYFVIIGSSD